MSRTQNTLIHHKTIFDDWRVLTLGIYLVLAGYAVMVALPVVATQWVDKLGFSEVEVGRVSGADLYGLALGALIAFFVVTRFNRRWIAAIAILVAIVANVLCIEYQSYEATLWLRGLAGVGAGLVCGVGIATIGGHSRPAYAFAWELFAFAFSQAAELKFLPMLSIEGMYLVFAGAFAVGLCFLWLLPPRAAEPSLDVEVDVVEESGGHHAEHRHVPVYVAWMVLVAVMFTYIDIGAYWAYIELATLESAADPDFVADVLVYTSFFSLVGCLVAVLISNRFGLSKPLMGTLLLQAGIVAMLMLGITNLSVAISMFAFNFCWVFVDIYQSAVVANVDRSGKMVSLLPAAQGLGNGIGPNAAASVLAWGGGYNGIFLLCAGASITAMLVYLAMYLKLRQTIPALADAS